MTRKKAIKTIMAVTHYGNRSWENKLFDYSYLMKKCRSDEYGEVKEVTNWMPLPKPPEVNTDV